MAVDGKYGAVTVEVDSERHPLNGSGEPVFLLRGQDKATISAIRSYRASQWLERDQLTRADAREESDEERAERAAKIERKTAVIAAVDSAVALHEEWRAANPELVKAAD